MTGTPQIRLDKATLDGASARMIDARTDFERLSHQLQQDFDGLRSRWEGQGGRAFQDVTRRWRESHDVIVRQLERLADDIGVNLRIAMDNDDAIASDVALRGASSDLAASLTHR